MRFQLVNVRQFHLCGAFLPNVPLRLRPRNQRTILRRPPPRAGALLLLLLAFALGRAISVAAGASVVGWAKQRPGLAAYRRGFEIAGGVVLVALGLYMLNAYFFWWPALAI